jgi:hypothetical protein
MSVVRTSRACADRLEKPLGSNVCEPSLGHFVKSLTHRSEARGLAGVPFPASNRDIDVLWVKLDCSGAPPCLFRGDQDRPCVYRKPKP